MNQGLGGDFDRIEFASDGTASLYFKDDHECSGFAIAHEATQNYDEHNVMMCAAPRFEGPISVDIVGYREKNDVAFPDNQFKAVGFEGEFTECDREAPGIDFYGDQTSAADFVIPENLWEGSQKTAVEGEKGTDAEVVVG
jgi:hypothetical protein